MEVVDIIVIVCLIEITETMSGCIVRYLYSEYIENEIDDLTEESWSCLRITINKGISFVV